VETLTEKKLSEIVETQADSLLSLARYILQNREDAEDAVQEVFLRVARFYHQYDPSRSLKNWLTAITVNCCRDLLRKRKTMHQVERLDPEVFADREGNEGRETAIAVNETLAKLNPAHRTVLLLFYMQEKTIKEMAQILKVPQVAIKVRLFRARKAAQKVVGKDLEKQ
jgi:RNA polymerase sigma factor (sigma-70 family)